MNTFEIPFFNNSLSVTHSNCGLVGVVFRPSGAKARSVLGMQSRRIFDQLSSYLAGERQGVDLPIDWQRLGATPFQKNVWREMIKISFGQTKTYGALAKALGSPGASRAVGTACAKNPILLAIPCHRVVGASGLGGFSGGGLSVKRKLLDLEKDIQAPGGVALSL